MNGQIYAISPQTAYKYGKDFKIKKIYKRDPCKPWTFLEPKYVVYADIVYDKYTLYGWKFIGLGDSMEPTSYDTPEEALEFMKWIKDGCATVDKEEDVNIKHLKLKHK